MSRPSLESTADGMHDLEELEGVEDILNSPGPVLRPPAAAAQSPKDAKHAGPATARWRSLIATAHSDMVWAHERLTAGSQAAFSSPEAVRCRARMQQMPHDAWQWAESMQLTRPRTLAAAATGGVLGGLAAGPIGFGIGAKAGTAFVAAGAGLAGVGVSRVYQQPKDPPELEQTLMTQPEHSSDPPVPNHQ